jgi:transposase
MRPAARAEGAKWATERADVVRESELKLAIEAAGASLVFIPPYSPDLNPIE